MGMKSKESRFAAILTCFVHGGHRYSDLLLSVYGQVVEAVVKRFFQTLAGAKEERGFKTINFRIHQVLQVYMQGHVPPSQTL